ncbi:cation efflux protein [Terfezia claveryi]|nr:cation efflux protein [Terfezia claveryi]
MPMSRSARIVTLLVIDSMFFLLEIIVGYAVHSLALVADSFHMLNDVFSLLVALWAIKLSRQKSTSSYTYGWQRAEVLGALTNGVFLLALCLTIFLEAIQRFFEPQVIKNPVLILIVGSCGLASNIVGIALFHDHGHAHGAKAEHGHTHGDAETGYAGQEHEHEHTNQHRHRHSDILDEEGPIEEILPEAVVARTVSARSRLHGVGTPPPSAGRGRAGVPPSPFTMARMSGEYSPSPTNHGHEHRHASRESRQRQFADPETSIHVHPAQNRQEIMDAALRSDQEDEDTAESGERTPLLTPERRADVRGHGATGRKRKTSTSGHSHHHHAQPEHTAKKGGHSQDLNMHGVFLHVMGDALGNIGVIATALFIWKTDFQWRFYSDPVVSLLITGVIFASALPLVKSASKILLQAVPKGIPLEQVKEDIISIKGVVSVHELHVWQLSDVKLIASLHIQVAFDPEEEAGGTDGGRYMKLAREIRKCLHAYGIHSSTIQPEYVKPDGTRTGVVDVIRDGEDGGDGNVDSGASSDSDESEETECLLECGDDCGGGKCCGPMVVRQGHSHAH